MMFPLEFDHRVLDSLPLPGEEGVKRVKKILNAAMVPRLMNYFRQKRGTDPILLARTGDHLAVERLEDDGAQVRLVSLLTPKQEEWVIFIHERIFDYLAFVIPSDPESRLGDGTLEERKMLAFAELMLRHEMEHALYPESGERDVIESDAAFVMSRKADDPTFYRMLLSALSDEMNGLQGEHYLALLNAAERGHSGEIHIKRILNEYVLALRDLPESLLEGIFPKLEADLKTKLLGECYRKSRDTSSSLLRRTVFLQKLLNLFALLVQGEEDRARQVFNDFKGRWGLFYLFQELDLPETSAENKDAEAIFKLFKDRMDKLGEQMATAPPTRMPAVHPPAAEPKATAAPTRSLKDRIEDARNNPTFPPQVMDIIDKNKLNAVGHSGSKYSELIETLLAIPWGRIMPIRVTPEAFEEGLNRTHYGLEKPKEAVCDFFINLIWRYRQFSETVAPSWKRTGSSFLFVGPPGVGKTSLAISIAQNLGIAFHKISLGGMRDESDLRGHGFTYEGSKPGAIVQGLIKMECMNGMFIMDEADKTEKFAIATLLEILDPEQNHLFHDKYSQTIVDIDLSNCHFILTANTLETVPPPVIDRCEVVQLDRYSVEEKVAIAQQHLIDRVRQRYQISEQEILFDAEQKADLLRYLIKAYTYEAGVRELERVIRTLFLRILRKEILVKEQQTVRITRAKIKQYLEEPRRPRQINEEDRVGEMTALGVDVERGLGSIIPIQATVIRLRNGAEAHPHEYLSMVHATGNIQKIMDESRKVATTAIFHCADALGFAMEQAEHPIHLHFMGGSSPKDGPSAGGAIALALASALARRKIRRDVAMTGEIDTQGRITGIGGLDVKLETACDVGCKTMIIPKENLHGECGIERLSKALKDELQCLTYEAWKDEHEPFDYQRHMLQVVAVDHILQAADIAFLDQQEVDALKERFIPHAHVVAKALARAKTAPRPCLRIIYVKNLRELDLDQLDEAFWEDCSCVLLVTPEVKEAVLKKYPALEARGRLRDFDPQCENMTSVVQQILKEYPVTAADSRHLAVVAPFFFLKFDGVRSEILPPEPQLHSLQLFANNYTLQGIKIKACKPILNRVYCHLAQLQPEELDACPFLRKLDTIYIVDLSFIPEKYRLDTKRAEEILNGCLQRWLVAVEGAARNP